MEKRELLNEIYLPLHQAGSEMLKKIRALGFDARLCYCNLHEVKVGETYCTEYFPMPEIEIQGLTLSADFGIALDLSAWLEITVTREAALSLDYKALANLWTLEVYGAENYLADFYNAKKAPERTVEEIESSTEQQVHLQFSFARFDDSSVERLLSLLRERFSTVH